MTAQQGQFLLQLENLITVLQKALDDILMYWIEMVLMPSLKIQWAFMCYLLAVILLKQLI